MYEMVDFEDFLYSIKLPYNQTLGTAKKPNDVSNYTGPAELGLYDLCELRNITTEEMDEDLEEDCDQDDPYDCPVKLKPKCTTTFRPLDFVYERFNDTYNISRYDDDKELVDKIKTGKGDEYLYDWLIINVEKVFGGRTPDDPDQNLLTGENDLEYARAARVVWVLDPDRYGVTNDWMSAWEDLLEREMEVYSEQNKLITF